MRLLLILGAFGGMIVLCVLGWAYGGAGGLIGGALGFVARLGGRGLDWNERVGNAYVGALMGLPVGLMLGGAVVLGLPYLVQIVSSP